MTKTYSVFFNTSLDNFYGKKHVQHLCLNRISMKVFIKFTATLLLVMAGVSAWAYFYWYKPKFTEPPAKKAFAITEKGVAKNVLLKLKQHATGLLAYTRAHDYNDQFCFMIDMSIHSGKQRLFIYSLKNDSIESAGLVTHGAGSVTGSDALFFSNTLGGNCTSLGKYKIGNPYQGKFGLAYKLHGLDTSNNKAFERFVVLHAHACVPVSEVFPLTICPSLGCPTVAPAFLKKLSGYLDKSKKPILMKIYQ